MLDYPVTLTPDDGTILVTFTDAPEAITFGEDEQDALLYAIDALETALSFYVDDRKPLPIPSKPKQGQKTVRPNPLECAKLGIYQTMIDQGIKKSELARRLNWHTPQVDRLFDLRYVSKFEKIQMAATVLGRRIVLNIEEAS